MATPPLEYSAASHPGLERDNNEDCFLSLPELGLWLVADGMGGHEAGEVASAIARDTIAQRLREHPDTPLTHAIQLAHRAILSAAARGVGAQGMGSTLVALKSHGSKYQIAWVGDSRAYLWARKPSAQPSSGNLETGNLEKGLLQQLSIDHSYVQQLINRGVLRPEQANSHPDKNVITQCLGMQELAQLEVGLIEGEWQRGQWLLLCSDGLSDELSDAVMSQILNRADSPNHAVDKLLRAALSQGGRDNITLQIIQSPLQTRLRDRLWPWVPYLTGRQQLDAWIFAGALAGLLGLLYYTLLF